MHIAFPILNFHHKITCILCDIIIFFYENNFRLPFCRTTTSNKLNRCKTLVLVTFDRKKKLYFYKIVRNDVVTPSRKKQHASELCSIVALFGRFGWFRRISRNAFREVSFTQKKRHFQPIVKLRVIKHMVWNQQFLPQKLLKCNSTLYSDSLFKYQIKNIVRKKLRVVFALTQHSLMTPFKIAQYYDQATVVIVF